MKLWKLCQKRKYRAKPVWRVISAQWKPNEIQTTRTCMIEVLNKSEIR